MHRCPIYFFFHLGTSNLLNPSQLINLDEVARISKQYGLHIKVIGAADSATGTESINTALSRSRADYIARELVQRGIPTGNITATHTGGIVDYPPRRSQPPHPPPTVLQQPGASPIKQQRKH